MTGVKKYYTSHMDKIEFTKRCIADALFELLKTKDFHDISVKEVVAKAGFSRMSYYRYFDSMEDVLKYYLDVNDKAMFRGNPILFSDVIEALNFFAFALNNEKNIEIDNVFFKQGLEHLIIEHKRQQLANYHVDRTYADLFINGGFSEIWYYWAKNGHKESPQELINLFKKELERDLKHIFDNLQVNNEQQ